MAVKEFILCAVAALCAAVTARPADLNATAQFAMVVSGEIVGQQAAVSPLVDHYEDPSQGPCRSDEEAVRLTGVPGDFCAPKCDTSQPCPTDIPDGADAQPMCCISTGTSGSPSLCALICSPNAATNQCPDGASCKKVQTSGVCTYDDSGLAVEL